MSSTIGLIGGCSAESTAIYYRRLNEDARSRAAGHGARVLLWSFDFADIDALIAEDKWDLAAARFVEAARWLEKGGADCVLITTNTMHRVAQEVEGAISVPLLHIVDASAAAIKDAGARSALVLGTRYLMAQPHFFGRLEAKGVATAKPGAPDAERVHRVIYDDLMTGLVPERAKETLRDVIARAAHAGL
jgi:aspartate racemase